MTPLRASNRAGQERYLLSEYEFSFSIADKTVMFNHRFFVTMINPAMNIPEVPKASETRQRAGVSTRCLNLRVERCTYQGFHDPMSEEI